jgi:hypothetical protein
MNTRMTASPLPDVFSSVTVCWYRRTANKVPQITKDWRLFARWNRGGSATRRRMIFVFIGLVTIVTIVALSAAIAQ